MNRHSVASRKALNKAPNAAGAVPQGRYLVDGTFTAADIMMGYSLYLARRFNVMTAQNYPNANAYMVRLEQHPGFIKSQQ